jgi:cell wall-associated NlpC family hydrolase
MPYLFSMKMLIFVCLAFVLPVLSQGAVPHAKKILDVADQLLEESQASYVYGGSRVGSEKECEACAECLNHKSPSPRDRLTKCPICHRCGIDCSHFIHLVFNRAGFPFPYLDTRLMLTLRDNHLVNRYSLMPVSIDPFGAQPGDLLVYEGHVVLLEKLHRPVLGLPPIRGDIIHATGGKVIRTPGEGIQRERFVELTHLRGPLRRILRYKGPKAQFFSDSQPVSSRSGLSEIPR